MKRIEVIAQRAGKDEPITVNTAVNIEFDFWIYTDRIPVNLSLHLFTVYDECVFNVGTASLKLAKGLHTSVCEIPAHLLNDGIYSVSMMVVGDGSYSIYNFENAVSFEVSEDRHGSAWHGKWPGFVRPNLKFILT